MFNFNDFLIFELKSDIYQIYMKWYKDIDQSDFNNIIKLDPTTRSLDDGTPVKMGKYSKWLLDKFENGELKQEDFYKAKEYLKLFQDNKHLIKKAGLELDINKYKSLSDIYEVVDIYQLPKEVTDENVLLSNKYYLSTDQADLIYEDEKLFIVHTKTEDANKFYGRDSQWCTTMGSFNSYNNYGNLYIIIDKEKLNTKLKDRRVQFHFEKTQFMDMSDKSCNSFIFKNIEVLRKIFNLEGQISELDDQVHRYFENMDLYDFIVNIEKSKDKLGDEKFYKRIEELTNNFNKKLYDMGVDKIIDLVKNYSGAVDKYFDISNIEEPSKLTEILFSGNLDKEYLMNMVKKQSIIMGGIRKGGKFISDISSDTLKKVGFNMKDDSLFITSVNYLLGASVDLSEFDLSENDKIYISYFHKIQKGKELTTNDAEIVRNKLSDKQKMNLMLFILDMAGKYYKGGINEVAPFLRQFRDILMEIQSNNRKERDTDEPYFKGIFEMVNIIEKIEAILSNEIISFKQYSILT